jgi:hypothetical protein
MGHAAHFTSKADPPCRELAGGWAEIAATRAGGAQDCVDCEATGVTGDPLAGRSHLSVSRARASTRSPRIWQGAQRLGRAAAPARGANIRVASLGARAGRIGSMAFLFLYLALRALLGALVHSRRGLHVKDVELLVLRQT